MTDKPELEIGTEAEQGFRESTIARNDAAEGFEQDPGERLRGDPDSAELGDEAETELGAALDAALEAFKRDDRDLTEFERLVRERLVEPESRRERAWKDLTQRIDIADRLEALTKQLAKLETSVSFVVSYVNTLALPVRDPLDLPEPPAAAVSLWDTMAEADREIAIATGFNRVRHNLNTLPGSTKPTIEPIPPSPIYVDPRDPGLGSQALSNDEVSALFGGKTQEGPSPQAECVHPNDCQFPSCLCGTEFSAMSDEIVARRSAAVRSTRGPYASVHDQNDPIGMDRIETKAEPSCTHTMTTGTDVTGRTSFDGSHPMTLSVEDVHALRDRAALTSLLSEMDAKISCSTGFRELVFNETEFNALRNAVARDVGAVPVPTPWMIGVDIINRVNIDGYCDNDRARKVLHDFEAALKDLEPNVYAPTRLQFTAHEIACTAAVLKQAVASPLKPPSGAPTADWESGNAYWLGSDGQFYVLDPSKGVKPWNHEPPLVPYDPTKPLVPDPSAVAWDNPPSPVPFAKSRAAIDGALDEVARIHNQAARGPEVLSGYDTRAQAEHAKALDSQRAALDADKTIIRNIEQLAEHLTKLWDNIPTSYTTAIHLRPKVIIELLRHIGGDRFAPKPSLLDQGRQAHDAIWTRILNEDKQTVHIAGDLRQALSAAPFQRAWATLAHLVAARADRDDHSVETLVLRLDAVRGMHKVLLAVRSALLHSSNT